MQVELLKGRILPSLLKLALPLMATAFVQVTYSLVDMIWLGRLGTGAVAASGAVANYIWFVGSFMIIPRVGVSIRGSQTYGAGDYKETSKAFQNGIQFAIILSLIANFFCVAFRRPLVGFYNLDADIERMAMEYFTIVALGFIFSYLNPVLSACYNSMGNSFTPFLYNVVGLVTNIILDPILIFGLGPFPRLEIKGAALATVLAQALVTILFAIHISREKGILSKADIRKKPSLDEFITILKLGSPNAIRSAIQAMVTIVLNKFMSFYGAIPIAVYNIGTQIESVSYMTSDGFAAAMTSFAGQNYGARKYGRVKEMTNKALALMFLAGCLVMLAFSLFGRQIYTLFIPSDPVAINQGIYYLIILGVSQPLMNVEIGTTGVFNGIGQPRFPGINGTILNILRIPLALILMQPFGIYGIWIAITISSMLKGITNYIVLRRRLREL